MPSLQLQNSSSCKTGKLSPRKTLILPPSPPALPPALAATILLPVSRNQTPQGPPRSGIRQGLSLPGWLLSRSSVSSGLIHVVANARIPSPSQAGECSVAGMDHIPFIHGTLGLFPPFDCCGLCCCERRCADICLSLCFPFFGGAGGDGDDRG